jgi:hypothetical protein
MQQRPATPAMKQLTQAPPRTALPAEGTTVPTARKAAPAPSPPPRPRQAPQPGRSQGIEGTVSTDLVLQTTAALNGNPLEQQSFVGRYGGPQYGVSGGPHYGVQGVHQYGVQGGPQYGAPGGPHYGHPYGARLVDLSMALCDLPDSSS